MQIYLDMLRDVLENGDDRPDRTGTGTRGVFGRQLRFDLSHGFPLLTTKKIHTPSVIHELLWFISGSTNIAPLNQAGVRIWNEWADEKGDLGPVYGAQWRRWRSADGPVDQLQKLISGLRDNPHSRRHILSAWNVGELDKMALPPCHILLQFHVSGKRLSLQLYQRSADVFLGVPFNIASYALLLSMVAQVCGYEAHEFIHCFGDLHIYMNHMEQVKKQLTRAPYELPRLELNPEIREMDDFRSEHLQILDYKCHPRIKAPVAV